MEVPGLYTTEYRTYNNADPSTIFKSDDNSKVVSWNSGHTEAELKNAFEVTFNSNGGGGTMSAQEFAHGVPQNLSQNMFTKPGSVFIKWNTMTDGTGTSYADKEPITLTDNLTLYAQWGWSCGDGLAASLVGNTLTIEKTDPIKSGVMDNFPSNEAPWYKDRSKIKTVVVDDEVKSIGRYAFHDCNKIESVIIGNGVTTIGESAFGNCKILKSINFPDSLTTISRYALTDASHSVTIELYKYKPGVVDPEPVPVTADYLKGKTWDGTGNLKLYNHNQVFVTFHGNGSTSGTMEKQPFTPGTEQQLSPNTFAKDGYGFFGWNTEADGTGTKYPDKKSITIDSDQDLYAIWKWNWDEGLTAILVSGTLTISGNGEISEVPWNNIKSDITTVVVEEGITKIGQNAFYGCSFLTTATIPNSVTIIGEGAFCQCPLKSLSVGSNLAKFEGNPFTSIFNGDESVQTPEKLKGRAWVGLDGQKLYCPAVTFNSNDGMDYKDIQGFISEQAQKLKPNGFKRIDYAFTGWNTKADGTGTGYSDEQSITINSNLLLYAQWIYAKHRVTYDVDGGSVAAPIQSDVAEGQSFKAAVYAGTKTGYTFGGWTSGGKTYQPGDDVTMGSSDMVLKAKWNAKPVPTEQYTVYIAAGDGGTVSSDSLIVDSGTTITVAVNTLTIGSVEVTATPSDGYVFNSWSGITSTTVTSDMSVTAYFSKQGERTWTISYNLSKGSWKEGYTAPTEYYQGVGTALPNASNVTPYVKDGYSVSFLGWYLTGDKSKTIVSSVTPTDKGNKSFTALWEETVNSYAYTVYYKNAAGKEIAPPYKGAAEFGTKVTPEIIQITGYIAPTKTETIVIKSNESLNTVTYNYAAITFTITVSSGSHGTIAGPTTVEYGSDAIFAIVGDDDYIISDVTVDGKSVGKKGVYTFASVTSDHTISAVFEYKKDARTVIDDVGNVIEVYTDSQDGKDVKVAIHYNANGKTESYATVSVSEDAWTTVSVKTDSEGKTVVGTTAMIQCDVTMTVTSKDLDGAKEAAASAAKSLDVDADDKIYIIVDSATEAGTSKGASISFEGVSNDNTMAITVLGDAGSISFDNKVIDTALKSASTFNVVFEKADDSSITPEQRKAADGNTVYDIYATVNGTTMTAFDGEVKISMPYELKEGESATSVKIYYVSDEGNVELIGGNWSNGYVTANLRHFSDYFAAADYELRNITLEKTGEGSVEASTYACSPGTTVKLIATPADGWKFVKWESQQVTVTDGSFVMPDEDVTLNAVFEKNALLFGFDWWWVLIIAAVVVCIAVGYWFYNRRKA